MSYSGSANLQLCRQDDLPIHYSPFSESSDKFADSAAGQPRTALYPTLSSQLHPRRIFTRQNSDRPLNPHLFMSHHHQIYQSAQALPHHSWPHDSQPWSPQHSSIPVSLKQTDGHFCYPSFSTPSPFPHSRLPPSSLHQPKKASSSGGLTAPGNRLAFTESVDPSTGLLLRTPEHPRLRTAQACQKCRLRKAKCSGEHPTCERCVTRGLVCEYAKEGRVRGPNKPKAKSTGGSVRNEDPDAGDNSPKIQHGRPGPRPRTTSITSSPGSSSGIDFSVRHSADSLNLEGDQKKKGSNVFDGSPRRNSFPVENPASTACRLENYSEERHFRRPRHDSVFRSDGDYYLLPSSDLGSGGGSYPGIDHQRHYHVMPDNFGFSSSVTIQQRHHQEPPSSHHHANDHSLSLEMFQTFPCHQQEDVSGFNSSLSSSESPCTASSISSPLTPDATPTSVPLHPNILHNLPSQPSKFISPNEFNFHFGFEPATVPLPQPPQPSNSRGHTRLRSDRDNAYGFHSSMNISIC